MGFKDLRDFIRHVDDLGELRRVEGADWDTEIGTITEVAAMSPASPMMLFDRIKGLKPGYRIVSNLLHTEKRLALALGEPLDLKGVPLVKVWRSRLEAFYRGPLPVEVDDGPVRQNIRTGEDVDLFDLPAPKWHERDGGRYFAGSVSIVRDPDEGWVNLGVFRLQLQDRHTLSFYTVPRDKCTRRIRQKYWSRGQNCPVAISLGHAPEIFLAGALDPPFGISEYRIAGDIHGGPIPVVRGHYTGLPVPATSEVVLEGEIPPIDVECHDEGPFGEATGYYASGGAPNEAVVKVKCIMHRDDPIVHGAPPMAPIRGRGHFPFSYFVVATWEDLDRCGISGIQGVYVHAGGYLVISLKQAYAGHAKQAMLVAAGSRSAELTKMIVAVDEDIDPYNLEEVAWAISTRCEPERDIEVVKECWTDTIHPMMTKEQRSRGDFSSSKVLVNACKPTFRRGEFPLEVVASPEQRAAVVEKWWDKIK